MARCAPVTRPGIVTDTESPEASLWRTCTTGSEGVAEQSVSQDAVGGVGAAAKVVAARSDSPAKNGLTRAIV